MTTIKNCRDEVKSSLIYKKRQSLVTLQNLTIASGWSCPGTGVVTRYEEWSIYCVSFIAPVLSHRSINTAIV